MTSPLHSACLQLNRRRRNALSLSNSVACDLREGLQMLSDSMFPINSFPSTAAITTDSQNNAFSFHNPITATSTSSANSTASSAEQTRERLRHRRNALVNVNSRALRMALNLPLSPCASPQTRAAMPTQVNTNHVTDPLPSAFALDSFPCVMEGSSSGVVGGVPRSRSNLRRRAAICFQTPSQLFQQQASSDQQQQQQVLREEKKEEVSEFLPAGESVEGASSTHTNSPFRRMFSSNATNSPSFPPRLSPQMFSPRHRRHSRNASALVVPRNERRRGAIVAGMSEIPQEWIEKTNSTSSPRIRRMYSAVESPSLSVSEKLKDDSSESLECTPMFSPIDSNEMMESEWSLSQLELPQSSFQQQHYQQHANNIQPFSFASFTPTTTSIITPMMDSSPTSAETSRYLNYHWSTNTSVPQLLGSPESDSELVDGRDDCIVMLGYVEAQQHHRQQIDDDEKEKEYSYSMSQPGAIQGSFVNSSIAASAQLQR